MNPQHDPPLIERVDAALDLVARRISRYAGLSDEPAAPGKRIDAGSAPADDKRDEEPVNPLRHWRWE
ncbi:MAG: hypothetical protein IT336_10985 [Thermomicrobiales bacterium]|nr:hypothetical protein [Thermomicrobiales bacterium]